MFYERYLRLCNAKGVKPSTAATEAGFNRGTVSVWKKKYEAGIDVTPDQETIDKICAYFGCSEQWLRGIENAPSNFGERVEADVANYLAKAGTDLCFALYGEPADELTREDLNQIREYAEYVRNKRRGATK